MQEQPIEHFIRAVGACRYADMRELLLPRAALRWITPGGTGEEAGVDKVVDRYRGWFGSYPHIEIQSVNAEAVGARFPFAYQFRVQRPDGDWRIVRQTGVMDCNEAGITAIDLVCTGLLAE